jgi:hypothetical protein
MMRAAMRQVTASFPYGILCPDWAVAISEGSWEKARAGHATLPFAAILSISSALLGKAGSASTSESATDEGAKLSAERTPDAHFAITVPSRDRDCSFLTATAVPERLVWVARQ